MFGSARSQANFQGGIAAQALRRPAEARHHLGQERPRAIFGQLDDRLRIKARPSSRCRAVTRLLSNTAERQFSTLFASEASDSVLSIFENSTSAAECGYPCCTGVASLKIGCIIRILQQKVPKCLGDIVPDS